MQFRKLLPSDAESAAKCVDGAISPLPFYSPYARMKEIEKFSADKIVDFVNDPDRCNLVCVDNGEVIGFLFGIVDAQVLFVIWLGVDERYRGHGHMKTLWNMTEEWARQRNIHKIWCDTNQLNHPTISFMKGQGLTVVAEFTNFWYNHDYYIWVKDI